MPKHSLNKDEKLEVRQYIAQELTRRAQEGSLDPLNDRNASEFIMFIAQRYDIKPELSRKFYNEAKENQALFLNVHDIIRNTVDTHTKLLETLNADIESYNADYNSASDAKEAGVYGGLKQKAIQNSHNGLKAVTELLHRIGGLSLASRKLALEEERLDKDRNDSEGPQEPLHYENMTKKEIDRRMAEVLQSGRHKALENEEIVSREDIINDEG